MRAIQAVAKVTHCPICDWQAASLSPALPVSTFTIEPYATPRVVTTLPRYLGATIVFSSSRAPPAV